MNAHEVEHLHQETVKNYERLAKKVYDAFQANKALRGEGEIDEPTIEESFFQTKQEIEECDDWNEVYWTGTMPPTVGECHQIIEELFGKVEIEVIEEVLEDMDDDDEFCYVSRCWELALIKTDNGYKAFGSTD